MKSFILKLHSKLYKTIKWIFRFSTSNILRGPCLYCSSLCFSFGLLLLNTVHYHNKSLKNDDWEQCDRILACLKGKSSLLWTTDFLKQNKVTWSIRARQFLAAIMYLPVWKKNGRMTWTSQFLWYCHFFYAYAQQVGQIITETYWLEFCISTFSFIKKVNSVFW